MAGDNAMKWSIALMLLVLTTPALEQGAVQQPPAAGAVGPATALTPPPDDRAKQWLSLVDDQNYADAYKQMGQAAQNKTTPSAFAEKFGSSRGPLGAMATRTIKSIKVSGQSATVQFDSSFARK